VEEESGTVAGVSEITLKKVVIKACKGKRMKPDEVEFFKKKLESCLNPKPIPSSDTWALLT
jgi:hypothetical protein